MNDIVKYFRGTEQYVYARFLELNKVKDIGIYFIEEKAKRYLVKSLVGRGVPPYANIRKVAKHIGISLNDVREFVYGSREPLEVFFQNIRKKYPEAIVIHYNIAIPFITSDFIDIKKFKKIVKHYLPYNESKVALLAKRVFTNEPAKRFNKDVEVYLKRVEAIPFWINLIRRTYDKRKTLRVKGGKRYEI